MTYDTPFKSPPSPLSHQNTHTHAHTHTPTDWAVIVTGSRVLYDVYGEGRTDKSVPFNPYIANNMPATTNFLGTPTGLYLGSVSDTTSHANAQVC